MLIRGPVLVTDAFRAPPVDAFQTPPGRLPGSTVHHRLPPLAGVGSLRWPQRLPTLAAVGSLRWPYRLPPLVAVGSLRGPRRLPPLAAVSSLHWPCRVRCQCPLLTRDFAGVGSGDDGGVGVVGGADGAAAGVGSAASADGAGGADTTAVVGVVGVDGAAGVAGGDGAACGGAMCICIYIYIHKYLSLAFAVKYEMYFHHACAQKLKKKTFQEPFFFDFCAQAWWKYIVPSKLHASVASSNSCIYI